MQKSKKLKRVAAFALAMVIALSSLAFTGATAENAHYLGLPPTEIEVSEIVTEMAAVTSPSALEVDGVLPFVVSSNGLLINQMYGRSIDGTRPVNRGFIEIYNASENPINLSGKSLQIQNVGDGPDGINNVVDDWRVIDFGDVLDDEILPSRTSLLIVTVPTGNIPAAGTVARYEITTYDYAVDMAFSNRNFSVAIVDGIEQLPKEITDTSNIIDLVGAVNTFGGRDMVVNFLGETPAGANEDGNGISNNRSVRRKWPFGVIQNTGDNSEDFESINYNDNGTMARPDDIRPRSRAEGAWPVGNLITVVGVEGAHASAQFAKEGDSITLYTGVIPQGHYLHGWTTVPAGIEIDNERSPSLASFTMPNSPVTVTADFRPMTMNDNPLLINQIFGNNGSARNSVSHGFIELYNPTNNPISLENLSVQIQTYPNPPQGGSAPATPPAWYVITFTDEDVVQPHSSFLIVSSQGVGNDARLTIEDPDKTVPALFGSRAMTVAIVANSTPLSPTITVNEWANVIDLVAGINDAPPRDRADNFLGAPERGLTGSQAIRRRWDGDIIRNTRNNRDDFVEIRYSPVSDGGVSDERLALVGPRSASSGPWPFRSPVVINQMYGRAFGEDAGAAVSRGFIEIYNRSDEDFNLSGFSLQVQNLADSREETGQTINFADDWQVLNFSEALTDTILPAGTSLLIVTEQHGAGTRHTITNYDATMPMVFSNRNFSAAIVHGTTRLSKEITEAQMNNNVHDLVGVINTTRDRVLNFWDSPASGISNQASIRRIWGADHTIRHTSNNAADFEQIRFNNIADDVLAAVAPRSRADGSWPEGNTIMVIDGEGGTGASANLAFAVEGALITLNPGVIPTGKIFGSWTIEPSNVTINNATTAMLASFTMPNNNVTVRANFVDMPALNANRLVINQMYGNGSKTEESEHAENAVSHGFIEIFNPTEQGISLDGLSLQLQNPGDLQAEGNPNVNTVPAWQVHNLPNVTVAPRSSFLVVSGAWVEDREFEGGGKPRQIPDGDETWDIEFGNRTMVVALVANTTRLSPTIANNEWANVIDLVAAINSGMPRDRADNFFGAPERGLSRQTAVRRRVERNQVRNTQNNANDFAEIRYAPPTGENPGITDEVWNQVRPRAAADGAWLPAPDTRPILASMERTESNAATVTGFFHGTGGVFASDFRLSAWDRGQRVFIGYRNRERTPVIFENGSLGGGETGGWVPVGSPVTSAGIANASAFQIQFPTTGFENITFSARQKASDSGPNVFSLAYRVGNTGDWTLIEGSQRTGRQSGDNTYDALNNANAETYTNFPLPAALDDNAVVQLRVVFTGAANLGRNGNTSINDIEIRGTEIGGGNDIEAKIAELEALIRDAERYLAETTVSADGKDVADNKYWVNDAQILTNFAEAIEQARVALP